MKLIICIVLMLVFVSMSIGQTQNGEQQKNSETLVDSTSYQQKIKSTISSINDSKSSTESFELFNRAMTEEPNFHSEINKVGHVSIFFYVNRKGEVTSTRINLSKTNTVDKELHNLALSSAKEAKFTPDPNGPISQRGTMDFTFKLN